MNEFGIGRNRRWTPRRDPIDLGIGAFELFGALLGGGEAAAAAAPAIAGGLEGGAVAGGLGAAEAGLGAAEAGGLGAAALGGGEAAAGGLSAAPSIGEAFAGAGGAQALGGGASALGGGGIPAAGDLAGAFAGAGAEAPGLTPAMGGFGDIASPMGSISSPFGDVAGGALEPLGGSVGEPTAVGGPWETSTTALGDTSKGLGEVSAMGDKGLSAGGAGEAGGGSLTPASSGGDAAGGLAPKGGDKGLLGGLASSVKDYAPLAGAGLLGYTALKGPPKVPGAAGAVSQANLPLVQANAQFGENALALGQAGKISPAQQAQIDEYVQNAKNQLYQAIANSGQDPRTSSAYQQGLQQIQQKAVAMQEQFIQQLIAQGLQAAGGASQSVLSVAQLQQQQDTAYQTALANATKAFGATLGGGNPPYRAAA